MTRDLTYLQRMAEWEREQDERNWNKSLQKALSIGNHERIEELVKEGLSEGFDFSKIQSSYVLDLIQKQF